MTDATDTQDERPFCVGDVVCLNSGGPRLTIVACGKNFVTVTWEHNGDIHRHEFPSLCVYRVKRG
jgi:uncharacterized protein YodC (DUF2158 family)